MTGGFHTACRLAGIEGLIWKDLRATFGTRLAEIRCDAFTIAQLLGHSDVRVSMRYVRTVEESKPATVAGCEWLKLIGGAEEGRTPGLRIANEVLLFLLTD